MSAVVSRFTGPEPRWLIATVLLALACDVAADTPPASGGQPPIGTAGMPGGGAAGTSSLAGASAGVPSSGAAGLGGSSNSSGSGGNAGSAGSAGNGGSAGAATAGGGAGGNAGSGGTGGGGGAGGACGSLEKANDGAYVRTGWTAEYTCTGGDCPPRSQADTGDVATNAFDGNYQSRWSTGVYQSALDQQNRFPLYFTVDLKQAVPMSKLTTHPGCKDYYDSPGTLEVQVSTDGVTFATVTTMPHTPVVPGNEACPPNDGAAATDTITFATTCARYVRLKGTRRTTSDRYWAIGEMKIYP